MVIISVILGIIFGTGWSYLAIGYMNGTGSKYSLVTTFLCLILAIGCLFSFLHYTGF